MLTVVPRCYEVGLDRKRSLPGMDKKVSEARKAWVDCRTATNPNRCWFLAERYKFRRKPDGSCPRDKSKRTTVMEMP